MTMDNCRREVTILGLRLTWWRRVVWQDGFYQPAVFEVTTPSGRSFALQIGHTHPIGLTDPPLPPEAKNGVHR